MGLIDCPKMSVRNYHYLQHNSLEERSSQQTITVGREMLKTSLPDHQTINMVVNKQLRSCMLYAVTWTVCMHIVLLEVY